MNNRSRYLFATLTALLGMVPPLVATKLFWPDHGQFVLLAVWCLIWLPGAVLWACEREAAFSRDPEIFSGWRGRTRLALETAVVYGVGMAGFFVSGYFA